jgi:NAD(P)H-hydrate epimerase
MAFPDPAVVLELMAWADALVVGGGMARAPEAHRALLAIITTCRKPVVADAETLHGIAERQEVLRGKRALLTPHPGEFELLAGAAWPKGDGSRRTAVRALAKRYGATVIVKGARDYISDGIHVHVDVAGSPYLTEGGYGDLLAGVAGAHLARGRTPLEAARPAALIVGQAGEAAARDFGEATLASDAIAHLAGALPRSRAPRT